MRSSRFTRDTVLRLAERVSDAGEHVSLLSQQLRDPAVLRRLSDEEIMDKQDQIEQELHRVASVLNVYLRVHAPAPSAAQPPSAPADASNPFD